MSYSAYKTLPERHIRILDLGAGAPLSPLRGSLRSISLDAVPEYEALSYTWGASTSTAALDCGGALLPLTLNLQLALARLRRLQHVRTLWIDQICINQNDVLERGQQVGLMGEIYRKARKVSIWLGEEDEHTEDVRLYLIPELLACCEKSKLEDDTRDPQPLVIEHLGLPYLNSPNWAAFRNIFHRPFFRRMLIVQEVVLGVECMVLIGSIEFRWDDIAEASFCLRHDVDRAIEAHQYVSLIRRLKTTSASLQDKSLLTLLGQSYQLLCTNPLDKVFGILGIASDIQSGDLVPDYSLTCRQVFSNAARLIISKYQPLSLLYYVKFPKSIQGLPSWVPDWTAVSPSREILALGNESRIDSVQGLGDTMPSRILATYWVPDGPYLRVLKNWERLSLRVMPYFTGEAHITLFWRVLIADGNTLGDESDKDREEMFKSWYGGFIENGFINEQPFGLEYWVKPHIATHNERALEFWTLFGGVSEGRRMITTTEGFIGLGPADALEGDHICFFPGLSVPILLRLTPSEGKFRLIGEWYLQGWMNGRQSGVIKDRSEEIVII
ncbi:HET-domain-containing protein [Cadophora sp. DSE1049]|nr:HET-domain-containing protein [Cadophora sp. DSE1049]